MYCLFGSEEVEVREIRKREIAKRDLISLVWSTREVLKRDQNLSPLKKVARSIVLKSGSDRPVQPVEPGTGHLTGSSQVLDRELNTRPATTKAETLTITPHAFL
ncbi:hypothetical protein MTR_7g110415 [Medicago truncatula]|uniref:Uncharacterized protein n=1 Tax=Medicago truncatula TaxID=3880 RepID=A0A072U5P3_MEDTR|nr:hypothetical protein MTR_7g110415 [Medicago truncatula]